MTNTPTRPHGELDRRSDADLVRASIDDPAGFDEIFTRHARAIFAFACARVGPDAAEDVTAETFTTAFRIRKAFDHRATSARPWLYGIAVNTLHRHRALERRWLERQSLEQPSGAATDDDTAADDRVDAERLAPRLAIALAELSPGERDVLLLHVLADLTHDEVATILGIRRGTAKSRLSRGRARLRDAFPDLVHQLDRHATEASR
jgi:RNA polymerase sigma-70 factor (ECF subfamily)